MAPMLIVSPLMIVSTIIIAVIKKELKSFLSGEKIIEYRKVLIQNATNTSTTTIKH